MLRIACRQGGEWSFREARWHGWAGKMREDEVKYKLALEVVTEWVKELMSKGYGQKDALQTLLTLIELRMFATHSADIGTYETELKAVINSLMGETY